jgi:hypothetical protein
VGRGREALGFQGIHLLLQATLVARGKHDMPSFIQQ